MTKRLVAAAHDEGCLCCCRFDIVLLLLDQHEPQWDSIVSEHVLANHQQVRPNFAKNAFTRQPW
jgi:DNA replicative helicase MCM subunit Mcm2 (Cdc46/Mcm family)